MKIELIEVEIEINKIFTDVTKFPMANMYDKHEFIQHDDELEIKNTITIDGFLGFLWRNIVAEDVAKSLIKKALDG